MRREQAFELNHSSEPLLKKNSALNVLPFGVCDMNTAIEMTKKQLLRVRVVGTGVKEEGWEEQLIAECE